MQSPGLVAGQHATALPMGGGQMPAPAFGAQVAPANPYQNPAKSMNQSLPLPQAGTNWQ